LLNNRGTFTLQSDAAFTYYNNGVFPRGRFHNTGTLRKSGASGVSAFSPDYGGWEFSNAGAIQIDSGVLSLRTENRFTNTVIRGAGRVRVDNGVLALSGTTTLDGGTLELASGHLSGESAFSGATGLLEWSGGELRGEHTVRSGARLRLSGSAEKLVAGSSSLINDGTVTWTGAGQIRGVGQSRIVNNGTFEILNDSSFGYYNNGVFPVGSFQNNGTILKQSSGRSSFLPDYGGWHFRNNGTIDARAGIFDFGPNFEETASSQISLAMSGAAPNEYASIAFGAPASLKGNLRLQLAAEHLPAPGTVYTLATYPSRTGEFVSHALPTLPAGRTWKIEYLADRMNLSVQEVTTALNSALSRSADGQFQLTVTGSPGQYALFQVTTNLLDWTTIATNRPFTGQVQFQDPSATNRWKFYRTVIVP
jgi:hypothetical protein